MRILTKRLSAATSLALIPALIGLAPFGARAAGPEGTIQVVSEPPGADVFVDGQRKGVTPLSIDGIPAGEHRIRIVKDGFVENSHVATVAAGVSVTINVKMTRAQAAAPAPPPPMEAPSEGWSTRKKAIAGGGAAAVILGGILLLGGGEGAADNLAPVAGTINVSPTGLGLAGVTNFAFTAQGSSDPENALLSYAWNFGDGATGTGATSAHVYGAAGSYTITLTVSDGSAEATAPGRTVAVADVNGAWVNFQPKVGGAIERRVRFTQSGAQLSGIYRTSLAPGSQGSVTGSMTSPRNLLFEARLKDAAGVQVGFIFEGSFNSTFTSFTGVAEGYLLGDLGTTLVFGREAE